MWQKKHEELGGEDFTVVGLALDAEGIEPARRYYEKFGVTFPSLVDPNYATRFGAVPKTFFIDEHGVVMSVRSWEKSLLALGPLKPVTDDIRKKFQSADKRLDGAAIARLVSANAARPRDLDIASQLASRYIHLGLHEEARRLLLASMKGVDLKAVARQKDRTAVQLSQAYLQLSRSCVTDREQQVQYATLSFYLNPTVGFGKQIARIIAPEKFDNREDGSFDNAFREATLRRLKKEREAWLGAGD